MVRAMTNTVPAPAPLPSAKFRDPRITARGERRATVALKALATVWFNTGTLCNLTCRNCYIESSPKNDRLAYLSIAEVRDYLDEIAAEGLPVTEIGFTGGEPFMNPDIIAMLEACLERGFRVLVLTNAMRPMMKLARPLVALNDRFAERLTIRVSVDHYSRTLHELERGARAWGPTIDGLVWLAQSGFRVHVAGRTVWQEPIAKLREGYARLFDKLGVAIDAADEAALMLFPEMDAQLDVPEITESCWGILDVSPDAMMCASSRMVVKRKGEDRPAVVACTLLPYDKQFELGRTLRESADPVPLNHPHCARFCVLGGGACSKG
jgi:uncharacterized Fe-S cluster-containing radical SAM superfamily protein